MGKHNRSSKDDDINNDPPKRPFLFHIVNYLDKNNVYIGNSIVFIS